MEFEKSGQEPGSSAACTSKLEVLAPSTVAASLTVGREQSEHLNLLKARPEFDTTTNAIGAVLVAALIIGIPAFTSLPAAKAFLETLKTLCIFWHVCAFALGFVFVWRAYRALLGAGPHDQTGAPSIRSADTHLWLSGFAVIAVGCVLSGPQAYLSNPKLWSKAVVLLIWAASTIGLRRVALPRMKQGNCEPMLLCASTSLACWFYGAFLGCAKGLANGAAPFAALFGGFVATLAACFAATLILARSRPANSMAAAKVAEPLKAASVERDEEKTVTFQQTEVSIA